MTQHRKDDYPDDMKHWYRDAEGRVFWTNVVMSGVEPVAAPDIQGVLESRIEVLERALRLAREYVKYGSKYKELADEGLSRIDAVLDDSTKQK